MAQPIKLQLPPRDPKRELAERLEQAPVEYAEAILDSFETLQKLHESGAFLTLRGLLGATDKIVDDLALGATLPESIRAMRNGIILAKMLGSFDPELLNNIAQSVSETFGEAKSVPSKPPGTFSLLTSFISTDSRRGLALFSRLFKNLGGRINTNQVNTNR